MKGYWITTFCLMLSGFLFAQEPDLKTLADKYARESFDEYRHMLSLANDAHFPKDIELNIQWAESAFGERGFACTRIETPTVPLLLCEQKTDAKDAQTVLIYMQMDGQPVDPTQWQQASPWTPVLKAQNAAGDWEEISWDRLNGEIDPDWRIFSRATSDAKGPVMMFLKAMDAMRDLNKQPNFNMKVILDFEEELGSPNLPDAVTRNQELLAADQLIIFDGPRHPNNEPTLTFGARGIATITLEVFGPKVAQHSGHYGNYAPNPAMGLAQLLAGMKDPEGRVLLDGFYDGIELDERAKAECAAVPDDEEAIRKKLGIRRADQVAGSLQEARQYPSLNIRGMQSGWVRDEVRTIVPPSAIAEIDVRLVLESDAERLIGLIRQHVEEQGYHILDQAPTDDERQQHDKICSFTYKVSYKAFRTQIDSRVGNWLSSALTGTFGKEPIKIRTSGGSIPISPFVNTLGIPAVTVPTVNADNNQHSPNENIRVGNYFEGIQTILSILLEPL